MIKSLEKKILFVATQFPPNESIGTQRIVKFIKYLKLKGWEIYVLTLDEKYYRNSINNYKFYLPEGIHIHRRKKIDIFGLWDEIKKFIYRRQKKTKNRKPPSKTSPTNKIQKEKKPKKSSIVNEVKEFISNMLQYPDKENGFFFSVFFTTFRLLSQHKIPYLLISSPPHSPVIPITLLRKMINFYYIVDFRDPWARSQWQKKPKHLYEKIENRLDFFFEKKTLETADVAIFNTDQLKSEFTLYYDNTDIPQKFHFISNGFDPELRNEVSEDRTNNTKTRNRTVILHPGTLYKKRNPQIIFDGLIKFREVDPKKAKTIEIKFIGSLADELKYLEQVIKANCLSDQIKFQSKLPYDQIIEEMKIADWLLLLQPGTTFQIPAKFYDYLLVKKPIWGVLEKNSVGETAIKRLSIGYVSHCQSVGSIVEFFKLITNGKKLDLTPDIIELQKYSIPYLVEKLEKILLNTQ
jgi:glycosyltransferase involved in cell wall biosynthesis